MPNIHTQLKTIIIENSYRENHEIPFSLTSGRTSPYYLDMKRVLFVPKYLQLICQIFLEKITKTIDKSSISLAGLTMGADSLIYGISLIGHQKGLNIIPLIARKQKKDHGNKKQIEGRLDQITSNTEIVLIDDVVTTGNSTIKIHQILKKNGLHPKFAFCLVDREEGSYENFKNEKIQLISLFKLSEFRKERLT